MTLSEIKYLIDKKHESSIQLRRKLSDLHKELDKLRNEYNLLEMAEFVNYLQIGEIIEISGYYSFSGFSKDPKSTNIFQSGEQIKIVKKNKKSIVIEVVKKHTKRWDKVQKKSIITGETNPGWNIRVDLDSLYHFYLKSPTMRTAFDAYVKRKNALDSLFDE